MGIYKLFSWFDVVFWASSRCLCVRSDCRLPQNSRFTEVNRYLNTQLSLIITALPSQNFESNVWEYFREWTKVNQSIPDCTACYWQWHLVEGQNMISTCENLETTFYKRPLFLDNMGVIYKTGYIGSTHASACIPNIYRPHLSSFQAFGGPPLKKSLIQACNVIMRRESLLKMELAVSKHFIIYVIQVYSSFRTMCAKGVFKMLLIGFNVLFLVRTEINMSVI